MQLILGDCLEKLKELPDNSVDSIVSDPPYGISFMGKKWDYEVPSVEIWQECLRVLKPGGHALVACGTRTQHRMAVNLEDAGFEIRDIVAWVYGSGFPKSLNIGKAIDKIQGNKRTVVGYAKSNPDLRDVGQMSKEAIGIDKLSFGQTSGAKRQQTPIDKGNSPYEGWGTTLKPSIELWTLCRKPLSEKTIAENVLKWGVGGINIDGCRVATNEKPITRFNKKQDEYFVGKKPIPQTPFKNSGRFPANFVHDGSDEVVGLFPNCKGQVGAKGRAANSKSGKYGWNNGSEEINNKGAIPGIQDSGSASRFFYTAKASKSERNKGLEGLPDKLGGSLEGGNDTRNGQNKPQLKPTKNNHPTVKPVSLMKYLCRLITPEGGIVLDPFMGSGSTGIGAKLEGFDFIGIELEPDYLEIAKARIDAW